MKLSKLNLIILLLNIILLPLVGNEDLNSLLHITKLVNVINFGLPLLLIVSLVISMIKNKVKFKVDLNFIFTIIFIISLIISLIFSITYKSYTFTNLFKFIYIVLIILLLRYFDLKDSMKYINKTIIYLTIFISLYGICQYLFNFQLTENGIEKYIGSIGRIKSTFFIATILDKYYAFILVYLLYLLFNKKENSILLIITYILSIIALGLTYSRSGLLIFLISLLIIIIYNIIKKNYKCLLIIPITAIILCFIPGEKYIFISIYNVTYNKICRYLNIEVEENETKYDQVETGNDYSVISREAFMDVAKKVIKNRPITGIGIGNYSYIYDNQNVNDYLKGDVIDYPYLYPHNMYLQLGAEIGIIGLISFMVLIIYNLVSKKNIYAYMLLFAILTASITETIFYIKDIAYITIILISIFPKEKGLNN